MRRIEDMGCHERRQRYVGPPPPLSVPLKIDIKRITPLLLQNSPEPYSALTTMSVSTRITGHCAGRRVLTMAGRYGLRGRHGIVSEEDCWSWAEPGG
jgi:hypothetical protein